MGFLERVLNALLAIFSVIEWFSGRTGQRAWAAMIVTLIILVPGFFGWLVNHGVALSRRGPAATIANTAVGQVQEAAMKRATQDTLDRMKALPTTTPTRP